jgi:plasmid stability protein
MRNITVSVPDDIYHRARVRAAERETSVSALVREFLQGLADGCTDFEARCRLQDDVLRSIRCFRAGDRLSREGAHERRR